VAGHRFPARVEAALYFCCVEATRPAAHVDRIRLQLDADVVRLWLDGVDPGALDLDAIADRIGAAGGRVTAGDRTLHVVVPVSPDPVDAAASALPGG
jgi:hypothetical protein